MLSRDPTFTAATALNDQFQAFSYGETGGLIRSSRMRVLGGHFLSVSSLKAR
jgi:hypothetical protein